MTKKMKKDCQEIKETYSGRKKIFPCHLLKLDDDSGILKYIIREKHEIEEVVLNPGDITYAFYWESKPFNLYKWKTPEGTTRGNYFNIADRVKLSREEFYWRDLILDILVTPEMESYVIDENEIPKTMNRSVKEYIFRSKRYILQNYSRIIAQTDQILKSL